MKTRASQARRIFDVLFLKRGEEVPAPVLHRVGSGKATGFVASISRRISDLRESGHNITCRRMTGKGGQVQTFYTLHAS